MRSQSPRYAQLFSPAMSAVLQLLQELVVSPGAIDYRFAPIPEYLALAALGPSAPMRVYWTETLQRVCIMCRVGVWRSDRWLQAMVDARANKNFLAFSAAYRGFLESAVDFYYSARVCALTLADHGPAVRCAVDGEARELSGSEDLERLLIHFVYGRKLEKGEAAPEGHSAETMQKYLVTAELTGSTRLRDLYAVLCQITHPAMPSLDPFLMHRGDTLTVARRPEDGLIEALLQPNRSANDHLLLMLVNVAAVTLRVVNRVGPSQLRTPNVDSWNFSDVPLWQKVEVAFASRRVSQAN